MSGEWEDEEAPLGPRHTPSAPRPCPHPHLPSPLPLGVLLKPGATHPWGRQALEARVSRVSLGFQ